MPFGAKYRIIDFVLSNFINSGIYSVFVLTQFKAQSLLDHISECWSFGTSMLRDHFITVVPAQMRRGDMWYLGTADAVYQNLAMIQEHDPDYICVFGGDHIYKMDISQMVEFHEHKQAEATIVVTAVPIREAHEFGVVVIDSDWRIVGFEEKPKKPTCIPGQPDLALVSMGNYVISRETLVRELEADAQDTASVHDFGKSIFSKIYSTHKLYAYDFRKNHIPGQSEGELNSYWKDVGTIDAYWEANMDLRKAMPEFNLYNPEWKIRSVPTFLPPAKFIHQEMDKGRVGKAIDSIVGEGTIISGGTVINSVLGCGIKNQ